MEQQNTGNNNEDLKRTAKEKYGLRQIFSWIAAIWIFIIHTVIIIMALNMGIVEDVLIDVSKNHPVASFGIPLAGTAALFLALILKIISGQVQFKILQVEFKGAASQFIIWSFSYLVIIFSIYLLWPLKN